MNTRKAIGILCFLSAASLLTACSDDDGQPAVCGNGQIEGDEVCDQTNLNGLSCATVPGDFTGGTLACSSTCTFDTSQCTTGQEVCGNNDLEAGEDCDGSDLGTATCETAGNFVGGTLGCTSSCSFDTSLCIVGAGCGNGVLDAGEDCDGTNLGEETCTSIEGNYSGGTLACANDCTFDVTDCVPSTCGNGTLDTGEDCDGNLLGGNDCDDVGLFEAGVGTLACASSCSFDTSQCVLTPSGELQQVIDHMDQTGLSLPVSSAYVTYLTPGLGNLANDPAGFTVQAAQGGPALFVSVDPATLNPAPVVGDEVSFTVTGTDLVNLQPRVISLTGFARVSQGFDVSTLAQNVSAAADLVSALDSRTSELITVDLTITGAFVNSGQGFVEAEVTTDVITTAPLPVLRLPGTLRQSLGLETGCLLTVTETPLWRFNTKTEIGAWTAADITTAVCNAPRVLSAVATSATTVVVTFSRPLDVATLLTNGAQFTITDGTNPLAVSAAALTSPDEVTLTTAAHTGGVTYTVSVAATLEDIFGTGVDQTANTAGFLGFEEFGAQLYLNEVDSDTPNQDVAEFVELWNNTGSAVDFSTQKYFLLFLLGQTTNDAVGYQIQLTGTLAPNGIHLVANSGVAGANQTFGNGILENGPDGVLLVRCDACAGNALQEFPNGKDVTTSATFTSTLSNATVTKIDAIAYDTNDADDADLMSKLGVTVQWDEGNSTIAPSQSLRRASPSAWMVGTPTPGTL